MQLGNEWYKDVGIAIKETSTAYRAFNIIMNIKYYKSKKISLIT